MWSHAVDMAPDHSPVDPGKVTTSFMYGYRNKIPVEVRPLRRQFPSPGICMGNKAGMFGKNSAASMTWGVLGAGDRHLAMSLVGMADRSYPGSMSDGYKRLDIGISR